MTTRIERVVTSGVFSLDGEDFDVDNNQEIADGDVFKVAGTTLHVIVTPGHSPGSVCLYAEDLGIVFTGDTLFHGGPGATGRSYSDHPTIVASITEKLLTLPGTTVVKTGHGDDTTIGAESANIS